LTYDERVRCRSAVVLALLASVGCRLEGSFACGSDAVCRAGASVGTCEATGYCSFADASCASGQRYADNAASYAAQCVVPLVDARPPTCLERWHAGTMRFGAATPLSVNSTMNEGDAFVSADELTLTFSSDRTGGAGFDIYTASRAAADLPFEAASRVAMWSSANGDGKVSLTDDGLLATVTTFDRAGGPGGQDIFRATRPTTSVAFEPLSTVGFEQVNTAGNEYDGVVTSDGKRVYLAGFGAGGTQRITVASRATRTEPFSAPVAIAEISAPSGSDADPAPSQDDTILLFTSTRTTAAGAQNLWYAVRGNPSEPWGAPQLVPDVNTDARENDAHLAADGCTLYFTRTPTPTGTGDLVAAPMITSP